MPSVQQMALASRDERVETVLPARRQFLKRQAVPDALNEQGRSDQRQRPVEPKRVRPGLEKRSHECQPQQRRVKAVAVQHMDV